MLVNIIPLCVYTSHLHNYVAKRDNEMWQLRGSSLVTNSQVCCSTLWPEPPPLHMPSCVLLKYLVHLYFTTGVL